MSLISNPENEINVNSNADSNANSCNKCGSNNVKNGKCSACGKSGYVNMVKGKLNNAKSWFNVLSTPEKVHLVITLIFILLGAVSTFSALRPLNIFGNTISLTAFVIGTMVILGWYFVFRTVMKKLQAHGYNKLAWVVAFQPIIDRVLLVLTGISLLVISRVYLMKVLKVRN
jgi:ribosomal protein L37E